MADIFLSYSRADVGITRRLSKWLEEVLGWSVWWDTDLNAGERWSSAIEEEAKRARCVIVLWSKTSVQSKWVQVEAAIGRDQSRLVPLVLDHSIAPPKGFDELHAGAFATWDDTSWHPEFVKLLEALKPHLGDPPQLVPPRPSHPLYAREALQKPAPGTVAELMLPRKAQYFPSPSLWADEVLYLLIPDRFSNGCEVRSNLLDENAIMSGGGLGVQEADIERWLVSGRERWQGGTLKGITSKLPYLQGLGVTTVWLWPVFKQRVAAGSYHGYAPQDFLEVDPNLGTRDDLVCLVTAAHSRGMYVILSGELHHSGMNWMYGEGVGNPFMPEYTSHQHPFGGWLNRYDCLVAKPEGRDDGVWPRELQDPDCYVRAGMGRLAPVENEEEQADAEYKRCDFFSLRRFNHDKTLQTLIACHRYWLALTDCDGFFLDCVAHEPRHVLNAFCEAIREYAARLGKQNFLVIGEVFGSTQQLESHYGFIGRTLRGSLNSILDNGPLRLALHEVAKCRAPAREWFSGYDECAGELGIQRALGSRHVSILDDPDGVFGRKLRFAFDSPDSQIVVALAIQLFSLGIPCIYYGTEQALGRRPSKWTYLPPGCGVDDVYLREAMFGPKHPRKRGSVGKSIDTSLPGFGPFGVSVCHKFDETSLLYQQVGGLTAVRREHQPLRTGRQYQREISIGDGAFDFPSVGEIVAWSRILDDEEILCIVNPNPAVTKGGKVIVDSGLNHEDSYLRVIFATGATEIDAAGVYRTGVDVQVMRQGEAAYVEIAGVPPGGVLVLSNRSGWQFQHEME